jgi:hypothetical protein
MCSLIESGISKGANQFSGDEDIELKDNHRSIHLRAMVPAKEIMERSSNFYCQVDRAETMSGPRGARGVMPNRIGQQSTMAYGESQIG